MFCPKCGAENPEGAKLCFKCGAELGAAFVPSGPSSAKSSSGTAPNIAGLLCYVLGCLSGIVFLITEKKSTFVKFHAWQSTITFGVLCIAYLMLSWIPNVGWILERLIQILSFVLWIILMIQAGTGKMWKLPCVGNWAEKRANE